MATSAVSVSRNLDETGVARAASQIDLSGLHGHRLARQLEWPRVTAKTHSQRMAFFMHCRNGINIDGVGGWCRSPRSPRRIGGEGKAQRTEATLEKRPRVGRGSETVTCRTVPPSSAMT